MNIIMKVFMLLFGFLLLYFSFDISAQLKSNCESNLLRKCNQGILIIGLIFLFLGISFFAVPTLCDCSNSPGGISSELISGFIIILSITLIVLSSIIRSESSKSSNCDNSSKSPMICLITGIVLLVLAVGNISNKLYLERASKSSSLEHVGMANLGNKSSFTDRKKQSRG